MGQKIDPRGFRLAVTRDWSSKWFAQNSAFPIILLEDIKIRRYLTKKFGRKASIGRIVIERPAKSVKVTLFTAKPGIIIGKKGEGIEQIKLQLQKITTVPLHLNVEEIRKPEMNAQIVADQIAVQLEKRIAFRRAMKRAMQTTIKMGAIGIKVMTSGRLNGVDIARSEWYREGRVPLHTLRANVDYATSEALTTFGIIGVKVWIYKGDLNLAKNKFIKPVATVAEIEDTQKAKLNKTKNKHTAKTIATTAGENDSESSEQDKSSPVKMVKLVKQMKVADAELIMAQKDADKPKTVKKASAKTVQAKSTKAANVTKDAATEASADTETAAKATKAVKKPAPKKTTTATTATKAASKTTGKVIKTDAAAE